MIKHRVAACVFFPSSRFVSFQLLINLLRIKRIIINILVFGGSLIFLVSLISSTLHLVYEFFGEKGITLTVLETALCGVMC